MWLGKPDCKSLQDTQNREILLAKRMLNVIKMRQGSSPTGLGTESSVPSSVTLRGLCMTLRCGLSQSRLLASGRLRMYEQALRLRADPGYNGGCHLPVICEDGRSRYSPTAMRLQGFGTAEWASSLERDNCSLKYIVLSPG